MADELDDDFLLEDSLVADEVVESDAESEDGVSAVPLEDGEDAFEVGSSREDEGSEGEADEYDEPEESKVATGVGERGILTEEEERRLNKKRKRKEKEKERKAKRAAILPTPSSTTSISAQPADLQADFVAEKQRQAFPQLSSMELDELRIGERSLLDTSDFRNARDLASLAGFVRRYLPNLRSTLSDRTSPPNTQPGTPCLLVISSNAQRVADLSRALKALGPPASASGGFDKGASAEGAKGKKGKKGDKDGNGVQESAGGRVMVAKLFARHFKVKEHEQWLRTNVCPLAAGTPGRVLKLIEGGSLSVDHLPAILIDTTFVDAKERNIFGVPETRDELFRLLADPRIRKRLSGKEGGVKVVLF